MHLLGRPLVVLAGWYRLGAGGPPAGVGVLGTSSCTTEAVVELNYSTLTLPVSISHLHYTTMNYAAHLYTWA